MVNSPEETEDLTQETFVAVYQKLETLKDDSKFEPWLFRIARNFVYQRYRTRSPSTVSIDALDENGQIVTQLVENNRRTRTKHFRRWSLKMLWRAHCRSSQKYREVFIPRLLNTCYQEIAEIVGRSLPSIKTDIHRARSGSSERVKELSEGVIILQTMLRRFDCILGQRVKQRRFRAGEVAPGCLRLLLGGVAQSPGNDGIC